MRVNSEFYLARSSCELSRILDAEGDALSHKARVHLRRMARALLLAAGENDAFPALERRLTAVGTDDPRATVALLHAHRERLDTEAARLADEARQDADTADERNAPPSAEVMTAHIRAAGIPVTITHVSRLFTESSKEISLVTTDGGADWPREAVMRRERPYAIVANSVADEFDILGAAFAEGLPVPRPLFAEADPSKLGARLIVTARVSGKLRTVETLGADTDAVLADAAASLAGLHRIAPQDIPKTRAEMGPTPAERLAERVATAEAGWRTARIEDEPVLETAFAWLLTNAARIDDDPAVVHGDFDLRNMLVHDGRLTGLLDWEFVKYGHRAEDLGYFHDRVTQLVPWDAFIAFYTQAGGRPIDPFAVQYHRILAWTLRTTIVVNAYSGYWRGQHADYRLGSTAYVEYPDHLRYLSQALLDVL